MGFELPEVGILRNDPEEIAAAHRYVSRHAPDLLLALGLEAPPVEEKPTFPGETHCTRGHEYTEGNTIWRKNRQGEYKLRRCRICKNDYERGLRTPPHTKEKESQ